MKGRAFPTAKGTKVAPAIIQLDDPRKTHLSFFNLVEAHILAAICREHGVKLQKIRPALAYVIATCGNPRPLIQQSFLTDGLDLFIERYGELVNATRYGQQAMKDIAEAHLKRIDWDEQGVPKRFYPLVRTGSGSPLNQEQPKNVVLNPEIAFGKPVVAGTGISVEAIYERYRAGDSIHALTKDFRLSTSDVEEAIRCAAA
ncbi:MAG: DUF433 domain-containing protein [Bryobacter sp.]